MVSVRWSPAELSAITATRPFLIKAQVIKKIWGIFEELRQALISEVKGYSFIAPEGLDLIKGQIARGERFHELPFVFMDFPQFFLPGQACTYRSFFWWGHGVVFALILQGPYLETYKKRIQQNYADLSEKGLHLSLASNPWEWRKGRPYTQELTRANKSRIQRALDQRDFIKLGRFVPIHNQSFAPNRIVEVGIATFRLLRPIICR